MDKLEIFRDGESLAVIDIDERTEFIENFMSDDGVQMDVTGSMLPIEIDDYIIHDGEEYTIYETPQLVKINEQSYRSIARFESPLFGFFKEFVKSEGALTFSFTGTAEDHVNLVLSSYAEIDPDWIAGEIEETEMKTIDYDFTYCRSAFDMIAKEFNLEFKGKNKVLIFKKHIGVVVPLTLGYGMGKGLYSLTRKAVDKSGIINRVYVVGGEKNIDHTYRNGAKKLTIDTGKIDFTSTFKRRAGKYENPDRYPKRLGTLTGVTVLDATTKQFTVTDTSLDFNLNDCLLEGIPIKVRFNSGELFGNDFEMVKYDHATKTLTLKAAEQTNGDILPSDTLTAAIGNKYILVDIKMPQTYIDAEEALLYDEAEEYGNKQRIPKVMYELSEIDEKYIRKKEVTLNVGDEVTLQDEALEVDDLLRATGLRYPLVKPSAIKAIISNFVFTTVGEKAVTIAEENKREIRTFNRINTENARINTKELNLLMGRVFDPDGKLAEGALSLALAMAKFGFDSQNYSLSSVRIISNADGDPNKLTMSSGVLTHNIYKRTAGGFTWNMAANSWSGLDPLKFYYIYALCSKTNSSGTWQISETPVTVDQFAGYWVFNLGQLFEVNEDGYRSSPKFTKGVTYIVGNEITLGRAQDITKQNYFDFETGQFNMGSLLYGIDWDVTYANRLTIRGGIIQNAGGHTSALGVFRGLYTNITVFYTGDTTNHDGSLWRYIYPTPTFNVTPVEGVYWTLEVSKGATGATGSTGATGAAGANGSNGLDGSDGAALVPRGQYDHTKTYTGSAIRIDAVLYGTTWYFTKRDAGDITGILPTDTSKWTAVGAQFESIATGLLLAELAYIENLGVKYLSTADTGARWTINEGDDNSLKMYNSAGVKKIQADDNAAIIGWHLVGGVLTPIMGAGITVGNPSGNFSTMAENWISTSGDVYAMGYGLFGENCKARSLGAEIGTGSGALGPKGLILANGNCSLDDYPEDGQIQIVKNTTGGNITLSPKSGATATKLYDLANNLNSSMTLPSGDVWTFQYYQIGDIWVQTGNAY